MFSHTSATMLPATMLIIGNSIIHRHKLKRRVLTICGQLRLLNFTPGTWTNADYTTPDMKNYRSSESIYDRVMEVEKRNGLNGHIMLFHLGTDDKRTDKFYECYIERLIRALQRKGYTFVALPEAVGK